MIWTNAMYTYFQEEDRTIDDYETEYTLSILLNLWKFSKIHFVQESKLYKWKVTDFYRFDCRYSWQIVS